MPDPNLFQPRDIAKMTAQSLAGLQGFPEQFPPSLSCEVFGFSSASVALVSTQGTNPTWPVGFALLIQRRLIFLLRRLQEWEGNMFCILWCSGKLVHGLEVFNWVTHLEVQVWPLASRPFAQLKLFYLWSRSICIMLLLLLIPLYFSYCFDCC